MTARFNRKILLFGLLGAAGCLAGWVVGEGFLLAARPSAQGQQGGEGPSIVAPRPPAPPQLAAASPVAAPAVPPPAAPAPVPPPPPPEFKDRLDRAGGKTGDVQISLAWDNYNDLDLICDDPMGQRVFFQKPKVPSGGWLDVDANFYNPGDPRSKALTDKPVENIVWPTGTALAGKYRVFVAFYKQQGAPSRIINAAACGLSAPFGQPWGVLGAMATANAASSPNPTTCKVNVLVNRKREEYVKTLVRKSNLPPGRVELVSVCEFEIKPTLYLAVPEEVAVMPGGKNTAIVKIARDSFSEPVTPSFEGDTRQITLRAETIPPGQSEAKVTIEADPSAAAGNREVRVFAQGGVVKVEALLRVSVKVLPPVLRLALPEEMAVYPSGRNQMKVRLARDRFNSPVTIRFTGDLTDLTLPDETIPADKDEADLQVQAAPAAAEGSRVIKVTGVGEGATAEGTFRLIVNPLPPSQSRPWSWLTVVVIGVWTALLALGMVLALATGQNHSVGRPLLSPREAVTLAGGGAAAGLVAGGIGQVLLDLLSRASLPSQLGFLAGWLVLGVLLGRGVCFFIPNLNSMRASVAGGVGGLVGALAFLAVSVLSDVAGRFVGAALLGGAIGLMVAVVEMAFRKAWLEIIYGPREVGTVNLGEAPVSIGSDSRACTVFARGAAPVAFRYRLAGGKILCQDAVTGQSHPVAAGHRQKIGALEIVIRGTAIGTKEETVELKDVDLVPVIPPAPVPKSAPSPDRPLRGTAPVAPVVPPRQPVVARPPSPAPSSAPRPAASQPVKAPSGDVCPHCHRPAPGRYCMICDRNF